MPCYEDNTITVELKDANRQLLADTLDELKIAALYKNNELTLSEKDANKIGEIKRLYAEKLLTKVAQEKKWSLKKKETRKFTLTR